MSLVSLSPVATARWPARLRTLLRSVGRFTLGLVAAGASIVATAWLTLQWGILPRIDHWRPEVQAWASRALDVPVQVDTLAVRGDLWAPTVTLHGLRLLGPDGQPALSLSDAEAVITPGSLLPASLSDWQPQLRRLTLRGATLDVTRDAAGAWRVAGLPLPAGAGTRASPGVDWLLRQGEVQLTHSTLRLHDARLADAVADADAATPLVLDDIVLAVQNRLGRHRLSLAADPPPGWGERIDLRLDLREPLLSASGLFRDGDWGRWPTQLRLDLRRLDLGRAAVLARLLPGLPADALRPSASATPSSSTSPSPSPTAALRLALRADRDRGAWLRLEADVGLQEPAVTVGGSTVPGGASVAGRVQAEFGLDATRWTLDRLQLREAGAPPTPADALAQAPSPLGRWQLVWRHGDGGGAQSPSQSPSQPLSQPPSQHTLQLDRAELGALAPLIPLTAVVGLSAPAREALKQARPGGVLTDLRLRWPVRAAERGDGWQLSGGVEGLSLQAGEAGAAPTAVPAAPPGLGRPGIEHARLRFEAGAQGGRAELSVRDGALTVPGLFEAPRLPIARLGAELQWQLTRDAEGRPAAVDLTVQRLDLAQPEAHGQATARWVSRLPGAGAGPAAPAATGSGSGSATAGPIRPGNVAPPAWPGRLTLQARLEDVDATAVHRYLPQVLPASVRHYVRDAVRGGRVEALQATVEGALTDFPFTDPATGRFEIGGRLRGVALDYVPASLGLSGPAWPPFDQVEGELRFERLGMRIVQASARLPRSGQGGATLTQVNGGIADLAHAPQLRLAGRVQGPLDDLLGYVNDAPIGGWLGQALAQASGTGQAAVDLDLAIPLLEAERSRVNGRLELRGHAVTLDPRLPRLTEVRGDLRFHERGFTLEPTTARALGGALRLSGGMDATTPLRLQVDGQASAEGLRAAAPNGPLQALAQRLAGQTGYRLVLGPNGGAGADGAQDAGPTPAGALRVDLSSPLTGLALQAPEPLGKPAEASRPLRLSVRAGGIGPTPGAGGAAPRKAAAPTLWDLRVGNRLAARWQVDGRSGAALGGTVQVGDATRDGSAARSAPGWSVAVAGGSLSLDAWRDWWADAQSASPTAAAPSGATPAPELADLRDLRDLRELSVRADTLRWQGRSWHRLDLKAQAQPDADGPRWQVQVEGREIAGRLSLRPASGATPAQLNARLTRLELRRDDAAEGTPPGGPGPGSAQHPPPAAAARPPGTAQVLPTLDIEVERFVLGQRPMGRLTLRAGHRPGLTGPSPAWTIESLRLQTPDATAQASGRWQPVTTAALAGLPGAAAGTELAIQLEVSDGGALLTQLGWPGTLSGGRGTLQGRLVWPGLPSDPSPASLGGELTLALAGGRFLQAEPGAARLLGILSLQSLPRRFLLDFRDLFQQGFAFDQVDADVRMTRGQASTRNLRIRGPQALVLTEGTADLGAETQDLRVWIVPEFDAGAASLAYAAINPVIGLGTLIGQYLLRKPLAAAATREWRVTGSWDQPTVTPVAAADATPAPSAIDGPGTAPSPSTAASGASAAP